MICRPLCLLIAGSTFAAALPAVAQTESNIIAQAVPFDYDRARNISVSERQRPDYDPLGIRAGGFLVFPRLETGTGYTDNVFLAENNAKADGYVLLAPSVRAQSDWSRHALTVSGGGQFRRFFDTKARNEDAYYGRMTGRADIGSAFSLTGEAQFGKTYETPFSGDVDATIAGVSSYRFNMQNVRGQYSSGRFRTTLAYARNEFDFVPTRLTNNAILDQSERDRVIHSLVGQTQYALSPTTSTFVQLSYSKTDYDRPLFTGQPNRDSQAYRGLVGVNMDLSALLRGSIGVGYTQRNYRNAPFRDEGGISAEARLEYFLSQLTTLTLRARRTIEDSNLAAIGSYFDNRASLRVDHELLRNLILNASVEYSHQDYIRSDRANEVYRLGGGAQFLISPLLNSRLNLAYSKRDQNGTGFDGSLNEFRMDISLIVQR